MVRFENVSLRYGHNAPVLRQISFDLRPGSFHFLTGPSGAGKTSLLRLIYMAQQPSKGKISLFDHDTNQLSRKQRSNFRRQIGVVFQNFRLIEHLSVLDNVALPLRIAGARENLIRQHVPELLDWVGLAGQIDAFPASLSGGQQQRVAIARAVIARPKLLLADEPTGNVDDRIALRLLYLFEELNKMGTTVLIATHSETLVAQLKRPRLNLRDGSLATTATIETTGGQHNYPPTDSDQGPV